MENEIAKAKENFIRWYEEQDHELTMSNHTRKAMELHKAYTLACYDYCLYMLDIWGIKDKVEDMLLDGDAFTFTYNGKEYDIAFAPNVIEIVDFALPFDLIDRWQDYRSNNGEIELADYCTKVIGKSLISIAEI